MRKLKPIPELSTLSESQLETLHLWLEEHPYTKVVQLCAAPAPAGFGLKVSRDKLYRHYHRQQTLDQLQDHQDLVQEIADLKLLVQTARSEELCHDLILQKAFDLLLLPDQTPETLKTLHQIVTWRQKHDLAQRRQRLAEHKANLKPQPAPAPREVLDCGSPLPLFPQESKQPTPAQHSSNPPKPPERSADIPVRQSAPLAPKPQPTPQPPRDPSARLVPDLSRPEELQVVVDILTEAQAHGVPPERAARHLGIELTPEIRQRLERQATPQTPRKAA